MLLRHLWLSTAVIVFVYSCHCKGQDYPDEDNETHEKGPTKNPFCCGKDNKTWKSANNKYVVDMKDEDYYRENEPIVNSTISLDYEDEYDDHSNHPRFPPRPTAHFEVDNVTKRRTSRHPETSTKIDGSTEKEQNHMVRRTSTNPTTEHHDYEDDYDETLKPPDTTPKTLVEKATVDGTGDRKTSRRPTMEHHDYEKNDGTSQNEKNATETHPGIQEDIRRRTTSESSLGRPKFRRTRRPNTEEDVNEMTTRQTLGSNLDTRRRRTSTRAPETDEPDEQLEVSESQKFHKTQTPDDYHYEEEFYPTIPPRRTRRPKPNANPPKWTTRKWTPVQQDEDDYQDYVQEEVQPTSYPPYPQETQPPTTRRRRTTTQRNYNLKTRRRSTTPKDYDEYDVTSTPKPCCSNRRTTQRVKVYVRTTTTKPKCDDHDHHHDHDYDHDDHDRHHPPTRSYPYHPRYGYTRTPADLHIRVPFFEMVLRRGGYRKRLGLRVFPHLHGPHVDTHHRWWRK